jgi:hypothetical protein
MIKDKMVKLRDGILGFVDLTAEDGIPVDLPVPSEFLPVREFIDLTLDESGLTAVSTAIDLGDSTFEGVHDDVDRTVVDLLPDLSDDDVGYRTGSVHMYRSNLKLKSGGVRIPFEGIPLIWDTGASDDLFDVAPDGAFNFRNVRSSVLLGGSSQHEVHISTIFDVGHLHNVMLLPRTTRLGYCIVSAGKLKEFRTYQYDSDKFCVIDTDGVIISKGVIGDDRIFYLLDNNLLRERSTRPTRVVAAGYPAVGWPLPISTGEVHHTVRDDALQGVRDCAAPSPTPNSSISTSSTNNSPNSVTDIMSTVEISSAYNYVPTDDESEDNRDNSTQQSEYFTPQESATVLRIMSSDTNDSNGDPDLHHTKLKTKHRKHTKYKYSNQPSRFRNADNNIMNYLHLRFGHASDKTIKQMIKDKMVKLPSNITYDMIEKVNSTPCKFCELAKSTRIPSQPSIDEKDLGPMVVIHSDIIGKFNVLSRKPYHYIALFVDEFTGYIMLYFMQQKSNLFLCLQRLFLEHVEYYHHVCRTIRADYDSMYRDIFIRTWLLNKKVKVQFSASYHHQGNGIAERTVRKVLDLARTLIFGRRLSHQLANSIYMSVAARGAFASNSKSGDKTPYEIITGKKPDLSYCVPAGSTAYVVHTKEEPGRNHKMSPKAYEAKLVGYPEDCKGAYRLLTKNGKVVVRRDVRFNDFEEQTALSRRDMDIIYSEEEWNKYVHSIEEDKNQFFDENDELVNLTINNESSPATLNIDTDKQLDQIDDLDVSEETIKNDDDSSLFPTTTISDLDVDSNLRTTDNTNSAITSTASAANNKTYKNKKVLSEDFIC